MNFEELNKLLKDVIRELLKHYPKSHIIAITFGLTCVNMFNKFINEEDSTIGIKPLLRILNNLGYDLHLVPVPKTDFEVKNQLDNICKEVFISQIYDIMSNILSSDEFIDNKPRSGIFVEFERIAKSIVEKL